nr:ATP-binding protein [Planobispora longispora]
MRMAARGVRHDQYAARAAREFTSASLRSWALEHLIGDTAVVVSELVTNAVRHGVGDPISVPSAEQVRVVLCRTENSVVCAVTDPSPRGPRLREPDHEAENGRGLQVVQGISHMWGWSPLQTRGKAVWAAFTISPARGRRLEPCP